METLIRLDIGAIRACAHAFPGTMSLHFYAAITYNADLAPG